MQIISPSRPSGYTPAFRPSVVVMGNRARLRVVDERERDREQEQDANGAEGIGVLHAQRRSVSRLARDDSKRALIERALVSRRSGEHVASAPLFIATSKARIQPLLARCVWSRMSELPDSSGTSP
jgi:hypothetical protein